MNDSGLMRRRECAGRLSRYVQRLAQSHACAANVLAQRLSVDILGRHEVQRVSPPYVMDCKDVGVVQGGSGPRLLLEAAHPVLIPGVFGSQQLECDLAAEPGILSEEYFAHAA